MATMSSAQIVSATALHNKIGIHQGMDVHAIKSEMPQSLPPPSVSQLLIFDAILLINIMSLIRLQLFNVKII